MRLRRKSFMFVTWDSCGHTEYKRLYNLKQMHRFIDGNDLPNMRGEVWYVAPAKLRRRVGKSWRAKYVMEK